MITLDLRPRSTVELLDASVQLLRREYPQLALVAVLPFLPSIALRLALPEEFKVFATVAERLGWLFASAGIAVLVSDIYLGKAARATDAISKVSERFFSVWGASILQGFALVLGFLLLVIPGFFVIAWTFAIEQAVMIEGCDAGDAFTRSRELATDHVMRVLGTMLLTFLIAVVVVVGLMFGFGIVAAMVGSTTAKLDDVVGTVVVGLVYPLFGVVSTLLYYDLRIRKEGFDLQMLAGDLGGTPRRRRINLTPQGLG